MKTIVDNLAVEYKDEGSGPTLVLLHGWGSSMRTFDELAAALSKSYRIVRLDLPGFGESELPPKAWQVADYAKFVADFLKKTNVEPEVFVGHSLGGRIVIKGFASNALSASKIVFLASAGVAERNAARAFAFKTAAKAGKLATSIPPFVRLRSKLRTKLYAAAKSDYATAGAMTPTYLSVVNEDLAPFVPYVRVPSLLIWGSQDKTTPLSEGRRLKSLLPDARLEVIDGAGHFVQEEQPAAVAKLIREFV